jgi:uncharacterized phage protein (TIGR02218 family)
MKPCGAGLAAILNGPEFLAAELYSFTLAGGTVLRYGDYDPALPVLVANGNSFPTSGLKFKRGQTRQAIGLEVGQLALDILADPLDATSYVNGLTFPAFVRGGGLDGATVQVDRCFMAAWGDCAANGTVTWFYGRVSDVTPGRTKTTLTVKSLPELLNQTMPRDVYQPGCLNTLYDPNTCTLSKAAFVAHSAAQAGSTASSIYIGPSGPPDGYFTLGTLVFTSGVNAGIVRTIQSHVAGHLVVPLPFPAAPAVNDSFDAYPGCDKTMAACTAKFANLANFRSQPFVPPPETSR